MKISRNDACHCGSGKKYKRCHLDADALAERTERAEQRVNAAAERSQLEEYASVLVDSTDGSPAQVEKAMSAAAVFFTAATLDDEARDRILGEVMAAIPTEAGREEFRGVAEMMLARHREMFPSQNKKATPDPS